MSTPAESLRHRIREQGPIPFAQFMAEALYGAGGYYAVGELAIGESGDYVTGSSLSPLFGHTTGRLLRRMDQALGRTAELFEPGYGTAAHLAAVVQALGQAPPRRLRAWDRVQRSVPNGVEQIRTLDQIAEQEIEGLVFSYELFDALPVHRLIQLPGGELGELWVELDLDGNFCWRQQEPSDPQLADLVTATGVRLEEGQIADLSPHWRPLYQDLARRLGRGLLVTCDYGYPARQLLDPRIRRYGTLACYRRHRVHRNPFVQVGAQDMTAHVDFSALIAAGEEVGLETAALSRQALWLTACGLFDELDGAGPQLRHQAMALLAPDGMGEEIRVLVQCRGLDPSEVLDVQMLRGASA